MQENFLHYIWKHKAFDASDLKSVNGEKINIIKLGQHNHNAGPDFFNSQLRIAEQLWAGNVELHIKHFTHITASMVVKQHHNDIFRLKMFF